MFMSLPLKNRKKYVSRLRRGEMEASFMSTKTHDESPLTLSAFTELQPIEPEITIEPPRIEEPQVIIEPPHTDEPRLTVDTDFLAEDLSMVEIIEPYPLQDTLQEPTHHRGVESKKSFSDRVHQLARSKSQPSSPVKSHYPHSNLSHFPGSSILTNLEQELASESVTSSAAPSRAGTGFSIFDRPDYTPRRVRGQTFQSPAAITDHNTKILVFLSLPRSQTILSVKDTVTTAVSTM